MPTMPFHFTVPRLDRRMTKLQQIILMCTAAAIFVMVLFPPCIVRGKDNSVEQTAYGPIWNLPPYEYNVRHYIFGGKEVLGVTHVSGPSILDTSKLNIQIYAATLIGGLLYLACRKQRHG